MGQLLGNLLNVIPDPIMILLFDWGIADAAIATVIGNVFGAIYYIVYFLRGKSVPSIHPRDFTVGDKVCAGVLAIGIPASGLSAHERLPNHPEQSDGPLREYGSCGHWYGSKGDHDHRHDLRWHGARRPATDRFWRRGKEVRTVQHDRNLLPVYGADRTRFPDRPDRV